VGVLFQAHFARAEALSYLVRTKPYNATATSVRGDIRTVGMGGANVGLADTFLATTENPAGLGMTLNQGDDNWTTTKVRDGNVQSMENQIETLNAGLALQSYPWGFSLGYLIPYREQSQVQYGSRLYELSFQTREFHAAAGRVFWDNRLSLGALVNVSQARTRIYDLESGYDITHSDTDLGFTVGSQLQLPGQLILGTMLQTPRYYELGIHENAYSPIPGFFQAAYSPWKAGAGIGWIPNRFFRADISYFLIGTTPDTALLSNDTVDVGEHMTLQPHMGFAYSYADFKNFKATAFVGGYMELTRIEGKSTRFHPTFGTEIKPWIFNIGFGLDVSDNYRNTVASLSVDLFKTMEQLSLIKFNRAPPGGFVPSPFFVDDVGLSRALVKNWREDPNSTDAFKEGMNLPRKLGEGVEDITEGGAKGIGQKALDAIISIPRTVGKEIQDMERIEEEKRNRKKRKKK